MVAILMDEGYDVSHRGKMFHSPWRGDKNRSLKIDDTLHKFVDYGDTDPSHIKGGNRVAGGDTFDFVSILKYDKVFSLLSDSERREVESYLAGKMPSVQKFRTSSLNPEKMSSTGRGPLRGYTNHSGGAVGADSLWGEVGESLGVVSVHYYHGRRTPKGNKEISEAEFIEGREHVLKANETLCRRPDGYMDLLARNWMQVKNADAVFAVGLFAPNRSGFVDGGTGWAVQMAIDAGKPVFLFEQSERAWFARGSRTHSGTDMGNGWIRLDSVPSLTKDFAGIGSRALSPAGAAAIRECYDVTAKRLAASKAALFDESEGKVNIWYGSGENASLSNLAERPFSVGTVRFPTVEHYFQWYKASMAGDHEAMSRILAAESGAEAKRLGRGVKGLDVQAWDRIAPQVMEYGIRLSFLSNPQAAIKLLKTGKARLTHTEESGRWAEEFPKILMRVRALLSDSVDGELSAYAGEKTYVVDEVRDGVSWKPLRDYMVGVRRIPQDILSRYCFEVKAHLEADGEKEQERSGKPLIAVGFPNRSGGYELRKEPFVNASGQRVDGMKKCTTKDISVISSDGRFLRDGDAPTSDRVMVFEGFIDFLSYLAWNEVDVPGCDCVVLNSTSMYRSAMDLLSTYPRVICFLDNDDSGRRATRSIADELRSRASAEGREVRVQDGSGVYEGYDDINEAWQAFFPSVKEEDTSQEKSPSPAQEAPAEDRSEGMEL